MVTEQVSHMAAPHGRATWPRPRLIPEMSPAPLPLTTQSLTSQDMRGMLEEVGRDLEDAKGSLAAELQGPAPF